MEERQELARLNPLTVIQYIKSSFEILIDLKVQERLEEAKMSELSSSFKEDAIGQYERLIVDLEARLRKQIKEEQLLKVKLENSHLKMVRYKEETCRLAKELETYRLFFTSKAKKLKEYFPCEFALVQKAYQPYNTGQEASSFARMSVNLDHNSNKTLLESSSKKSMNGDLFKVRFIYLDH